MDHIHRDAFIHPQAIVEPGAEIGADTRVWAFAHVLAGAKIGKDCNLCDHTFIENKVSIGDRVTVKCGVYIWDGVSIADDVFVGQGVAFTNDKYPRSKQYLEEYPKTIVEQGASVGANAVILPGITIGARAAVGAGAVVTNNVPAYAKVVGNPARITGYLDTIQVPSPLASLEPSEPRAISSDVAGVTIYVLPYIEDLRGDISVGEVERHIPFEPKRYFLVMNVPSRKVRGEHAHKKCHQFMVCVKGSVALVVDDGIQRQEIMLDHPNIGVHIPPKVWGIQYKYSEDAVLLVLASDPYDPIDYIRRYDDFLTYIQAENA